MSKKKLTTEMKYFQNYCSDFSLSCHFVFCPVFVSGLPVHSGGWVVADVIDESYVSLVQFQCQRVVVLLI